MKCMQRNLTPFYYAQYLGKTELMDEYGNPTGEYDITHGNPIAAKGNISAARGETNTRQFGEDAKYDKVIVLDTPNTPIDEYSVFWIDTLPVIDGTGATDTMYDYVVKKVARSINSVSIAVSKVIVSE